MRKVPSREDDSSQRASALIRRSVMRSMWPLNWRTLLTASMSYLCTPHLLLGYDYRSSCCMKKLQTEAGIAAL